MQNICSICKSEMPSVPEVDILQEFFGNVSMAHLDCLKREQLKQNSKPIPTES